MTEPSAPAPQTFDTTAGLNNALQELNYEHETATAAVVANGVLMLAYCTDPDGEWFFESGDPEDHMAEDESGWREYKRTRLSDLSRGPYTIIWPTVLDAQ